MVENVAIHLDEIKNFMGGKKAEDLIEILHRVQDTYGYIPKEIVELISTELRIPISRIYGVITFYSRFSLNPKGKFVVSVCMGTACYVKNAEAIMKEFSKLLGIEPGETTEDMQFSLIETRCVGECAAAPVVLVNDQVYSHVTVEGVPQILAKTMGK